MPENVSPDFTMCVPVEFEVFLAATGSAVLPLRFLSRFNCDWREVTLSSRAPICRFCSEICRLRTSLVCAVTELTNGAVRNAVVISNVFMMGLLLPEILFCKDLFSSFLNYFLK